MAIDISSLFVYRMIAIQNLEDDLTSGLICKSEAKQNPARVVIGNSEIITERDKKEVTCFPGTFVNDYIPFYFSTRTPMLLNIKTGHGVARRPQSEIIYLCFKLSELATDKLTWCFTDGNAAKRITRFYNDLKDIESIDWTAIKSTDFGPDCGDEDRVRKKHAEFLVKGRLPATIMSHIAVIDKNVKGEVETILAKNRLSIEVLVQPKFYF